MLILPILAAATGLVFGFAQFRAVVLLPALFGAEAIWFSAFVAEIFALVLGGCLLLRLRKRYGYSG